MFKIILVGAGQIGSRYLSGLAKISQKIKIFVVDPNIKSKNICRQRWIDACGDKSFHKIEFLSDLNFQNTKMDLAIIATSSLNRSSLIQDIALKFNPQYWVLEKILAQSIRDLDLIKYVYIYIIIFIGICITQCPSAIFHRAQTKIANK